MQCKAVEAMVELHRRELGQVAGATPWRGEAGRDAVATAARTAVGVPVPRGRARRRAAAPRLGTWLIHAGIRLGGASVRTS